MRRGRDQAGGVLAEVALSLPLVILTVLGGLTLGYMANVKLTLALTARQAAREAVIRAEHGVFTAPAMNVTYGYNGVVTTYGLPRAQVESVLLALPGNGQPVIYVASCYRLPLAFPDISALAKLVQPPAPSRVAESIANNPVASGADEWLRSSIVSDDDQATYEAVLAELEHLDALIANAENTVADVKANLVGAQADFKKMAELAKRLFGKTGQDTKLLQYLPSRPKANNVADLAAAARYRCEDQQSGGQTLIAYAAYPYHPVKGGGT